MVLWVEGRDLSRKFLKRRWKVADAKSIAAMTPRARSGEVASGFPLVGK